MKRIALTLTLMLALSLSASSRPLRRSVPAVASRPSGIHRSASRCAGRARKESDMSRWHIRTFWHENGRITSSVPSGIWTESPQAGTLLALRDDAVRGAPFLPPLATFHVVMTRMKEVANETGR